MQSAGKGVTVYILDSGIDTNHPEFEKTSIRNGENFTEEPFDDLNGHGTHIAGIIAGKSTGVAKSVQLVSVKIIDREGRGKMSSLLKALSFVAKDAAN